MALFEIIKCHGSGNDFIMVDCVAQPIYESVDWEAFARVACNRECGIGSDGLLLLVRTSGGGYAMDMLNPDGTHAEMCGNGIRCVARLAMLRGYIPQCGVLGSGGRDYAVARAGFVAEGIEAYSVAITIDMDSEDFAFFGRGEHFVAGTLPTLCDTLRFTALNLGNPHIVARVEGIDLGLLEHLGQSVISRKELFPRGVNVSLYERRAPRKLFVATYERGAGITLSCGTAMTASATAAALLGEVDAGERIEVSNRGGRVFCTTEITAEGITTRLEGNATFEWWGRATFDGVSLGYEALAPTGEAELWQNFVDSINENNAR